MSASRERILLVESNQEVSDMIARQILRPPGLLCGHHRICAISRLGKSVLVMPLKVRNKVVGLLTVLRKEAVPFGSNSQSLLSAVTDYASILIVNVRLFQALEARARRLQQIAEAAQAVTHGNANPEGI